MAGLLVMQILVVIATMGWYGLNVLKLVDSYFQSEFKRHLEAERGTVGPPKGRMEPKLNTAANSFAQQRLDGRQHEYDPRNNYDYEPNPPEDGNRYEEHRQCKSHPKEQQQTGRRKSISPTSGRDLETDYDFKDKNGGQFVGDDDGGGHLHQQTRRQSDQLRVSS
jgi:hypothetical protein